MQASDQSTRPMDKSLPSAIGHALISQALCVWNSVLLNSRSSDVLFLDSSLPLCKEGGPYIKGSQKFMKPVSDIFFI